MLVQCCNLGNTALCVAWTYSRRYKANENVSDPACIPNSLYTAACEKKDQHEFRKKYTRYSYMEVQATVAPCSSSIFYGDASHVVCCS